MSTPSTAGPGQRAPSDPTDVLAHAATAVAAIKAKDAHAWAAIVDPKRGVRFSPYAFVDKEADRVLSRDQLEHAFADRTAYKWGALDGSGDPINLNFARYVQRFVYDVDFERAPQIAVDRALSSGNTTDNTSTVYPSAHVVEYYFPGFDKKAEGFDWRALRLVFERNNGGWFLVGVIHSEWTT